MDVSFIRRFVDASHLVRIEVTLLYATVSGGDLAFTVSIERDEVRLAGQDKAVPRALRVTQIFRKENGSFCIVTQIRWSKRKHPRRSQKNDRQTRLTGDAANGYPGTIYLS